MSEQVTPVIKATKGFQSHTAVVEAGGLTVFEIWDSQEDRDAFFDATIRPNMQQEPSPADVFEVVRTVTP